MKHQQFLWVNCDKPQYLSSSDFGNEKIRNFAGYTWNPGKCSSALFTLLGDRWKDDRIILIGQYKDENETNPLILEMRRRFDDLEYFGDILYGALSSYENMAKYFITANYDELSEGLEDSDKNFNTEPIFYRYIVNHTKREYYYRYNLKSVNNWLNPLAFLLMSGKDRCNGNYGLWISDRLEVTNDKKMVKELEYEDKTRIYNYRFFTNEDPMDHIW